MALILSQSCEYGTNYGICYPTTSSQKDFFAEPLLPTFAKDSGTDSLESSISRYLM